MEGSSLELHSCVIPMKYGDLLLLHLPFLKDEMSQIKFPNTTSQLSKFFRQLVVVGSSCFALVFLVQETPEGHHNVFLKDQT